MSPALIAIIISLVEEAVKLAPGVYEDLQLIFSKPNPTPDDWEALRAKVLSVSYADYVPASALASAGSPGVVGSGTIPPAAETPVSGQPGASEAAENPPQTQTQPETAVADVPAYLPDGSPNPDFTHQA